MTHIVNARYAKVSIGSPSGNRVARILRRGAVVPEGVDTAQLEHLVSRGIISPVEVEPPAPTFPEGDPTDKWTGKEIDAYARANGIDLTGAKNKADKLAAVLGQTEEPAAPPVEPVANMQESSDGDS